MSRKTRSHKNNMESQNIQMTDTQGTSRSTESNIGSTARQKLNTVVGTVNNNKVLIGSIAGACGSAIFLLATDSGRRIRSGIQERIVDLYDYVSDQVGSGWSKMQNLAQNVLSRSESEHEHQSPRMRRIA